ncbi:MarR family winged helix-turn-helix transcriptional regulator [Cytobacillus horneckiae]|uniref:MarR family transcriptional regulator n=1 Tax=Cytobacillus horneckiae TaxID=549687 RepID=A0A2N0ZIZ9_9BACI|nr:MarR family winged helix-turn-helix transcriptional regulator [Cytobacillus horneckiae]MEC1158994.1 MarR family winged helix-turn-helix transcriptional regulator [Cytobacillus horneckiae]MED2937948.1 MarR family winged helix-turn-helix transcriptional regulator [Cytobacillus horneckiae]PKG29485.1 MarR family transcriptional regulator [Cytobacillus horneckiae]
MDKNELFNKLVSFTSSVHRVTNELTKNTKSNSISQVQYNILEFIAVSQPVTPSEINDCLSMSMSNTSRELSKLSEKKLIKKVNDSKDRRKQYIHLSKDGEVIMKEAFATIETRFLNRIQHASKEDLEEIERAIDTLQEKLFHP